MGREDGKIVRNDRGEDALAEIFDREGLLGSLFE
jgi:hypothetical protein